MKSANTRMIHLRLVFLTLALFLILDQSSFAQVEVDNNTNGLVNFSQVRKYTERVKDHEVYRGDVYLKDEWVPAEFELNGNDRIVVDSVKLNTLRGAVEIHQDGQHLVIDNKMYRSFTFFEKYRFPTTFKYTHYYFVDGNRLPGIIKVIDLGDYSVLVAYDSAIQQVSGAKNPLMLEKLKKDKIRLTKLRYIEKDGALTRIKSKKDFHKFFDESKQMKNYISRNKLSHKEEEDIARAVHYAFKEG